MRITVAVLLAMVLPLAACAPSAYRQGRLHLADGKDDAALVAFTREIARHPQSAPAWREAGVAWYNLGDHARADSALTRAAEIAVDARTTLYRGLVQEARGDLAAARGSFRQTLALRPDREIRRAANAHLETILRRDAEASARAAREAEDRGSYVPPAGNTVAVVAFDTGDLPPELAPLGAGLADFVALDLGKVSSLQVVERLQIARIVGELTLMASGIVEPSTRVRAGQLLGARQLVAGTIQAPQADRLELFGAVANVDASTERDIDPIRGAQTAFFRMQKDLVFAIIANLGITLTAAERDAIQTVPTESLTAFLAYSRGIIHREAGRYREAAAEFQNAVQADGGFAEAAAMAEMTADLADAAEHGTEVTATSGVADDTRLGDFLTTMVGETGVMPVSLHGGPGGPPRTTPPRTGSVTDVLIIIGGSYR